MRTSTIKSIGALALTAAGTAFVFGFRTSDNPAGDTNALADTGKNASSNSGANGAGRSGSAGSAAGSGTTGTTGTSGTGSSGTDATSAAYADGTWTGAAVSEPWGAFQVRVVIRGGSITDVAVVEAPSDRHSRGINSQAVPLLTESTIASQGASVDMVSGATWTSDSYARSLQSALDEAATAA
jgi:uncharacterized protein with FMN-binding domain